MKLIPNRLQKESIEKIKKLAKPQKDKMEVNRNKKLRICPEFN